MTKKFYRPSLLLLFLDPGSGRGKNQDPGSGINIPDPQHCNDHTVTSYFLSRIFVDKKITENGSLLGDTLICKL